MHEHGCQTVVNGELNSAIIAVQISLRSIPPALIIFGFIILYYQGDHPSLMS
jgi:hypothetical protein